MNGEVGKSVADRLYLHTDFLGQAAPELRRRLDSAVATAGFAEPVFNLARFDGNAPVVSLLHYPGFYDDPFPALAASWLVDLQAGTVSFRTYAESLNPPILHRKELLLPADHPRRAEYAALTEACETIGLFDEPTRIGYRRQWEQLVREKGYRIVGHQLVPIGNLEAEDLQEAVELGPLRAGWQAARHLTALQRYGFSAPVQSLARFGFLDGQRSLFDYGCGRGDDVRGLIENGLDAAGWDPYYAPDNPIQSAHIVNLGFVINVIEDFEERLEALTRAWSLAETLLVVSVMLANQNDPRGERFRDGVMTRRGTFQKYYTQGEIKAFLESVLDEEAIPVAPGVLYCFRDKEAEQRFLMDRYRSRRSRLREPSLRAPARERAERVPRERRDRGAERHAAYREPLDRLWELWLRLGRRPDPAEVPDLLALTEGFGSLPKALRFLAGRQDPAELEAAQGARIADLTVYLALNQFERRRPYRHLEPGLQRDIKAFFGDYGVAQGQARALLFRIGDTQAIAEACRWASEQGLGWLEWEDSRSAALGAMPPAAAETEGSLRGGAPLLRAHPSDHRGAALGAMRPAAAETEGSLRGGAPLLRAHPSDHRSAALGATSSQTAEIEGSLRGGAPHLRGEEGSGGVKIQPKGSLTLHSALVERLPPLLRVYLGCAAVLYGDVRSADLVKVHIGSGKLSLMRYDDFEGRALPRMVERVKIKLREQDVDYFAYGEGTDYAPPYLFRKSRFINEEFPGYPEQVAFEETLEGLGLFDLSGYGPDPDTFDRTLARHRWQVEGLRLVRPSTPPSLDDPCGRFLTFRQLIACGETQARTGLANLPRQAKSWNALQDLAEQVLDPVIDWFGMIRLTYGFCSPELAREIPARIDPKLDQHAAHEVNRRGRPVCARLGAAVDFIVEDEDMLEVARWVAANTPFDRLYFYGADRPIHVSYGPEQSRQVVRMVAAKDGRLVPRVTPLDAFLGVGFESASE